MAVYVTGDPNLYNMSEVILTIYNVVVKGYHESVRVKGGKSLRNGMWHGVRNGIIMQNMIYAGNKLTEERILFLRQFYKSSSFFDADLLNINNNLRIRSYDC